MKQLRTYHYFASKYLMGTGLVLIGLFLSLPGQTDVELTLGISAVIAMVGLGFGVRNLIVNQKKPLCAGTPLPMCPRPWRFGPSPLPR